MAGRHSREGQVGAGQAFLHRAGRLCQADPVIACDSINTLDVRHRATRAQLGQLPGFQLLVVAVLAGVSGVVLIGPG